MITNPEISYLLTRCANSCNLQQRNTGKPLRGSYAISKAFQNMAFYYAQAPISASPDSVMLIGPKTLMTGAQLQACVFSLAIILWIGNLKSNNSLSFKTEPYYRRLVAIVSEMTWLKSLLSELRIPVRKPPILWCDNLNTMLLAANQHHRTKHIELHLYFVPKRSRPRRSTYVMLPLPHNSLMSWPKLSQANNLWNSATSSA